MNDTLNIDTKDIKVLWVYAIFPYVGSVFAGLFYWFHSMADKNEDMESDKSLRRPTGDNDNILAKRKLPESTGSPKSSKGS